MTPCPDWLVRVQHADRRIKDGRKLRAVIDAAPVLTEITFDRPASNGRRARTVHQHIKVVRVTLKAPLRPDRTLPEIAVTVLLATEAHAPGDEDPLDWLLLTNQTVDTPANGRHPWWLPQPKKRWLSRSENALDRFATRPRFRARA